MRSTCLPRHPAAAYLCLVRPRFPDVHKKRVRTGWVVLFALLVAGVIAFAVSDTVRFVVCSAAGAYLYGFPSDSDRAEAQEIREKIASVHYFTRNSPSQPDQPPVFSNPGSKMLLTQPTVIQVYDVRDRAEQDHIAEVLKELVAEKKFKPFELCFYDHENWVVDGNVGGRGPETQLRRLRITAHGIRDIAGQQVITYPTP
jgi:hypothetical protein